MRSRRAWLEAERIGERFRSILAAPLLAVALLVAVSGPASATGEGEAPMVVSAEVSSSLGVVSTAQSDTEISPESDTEPRLVNRESSERVDGVVIALWSIAAGMTVMLVLFLWHTSPRRRLRLARRRSTQLYDGEADRAEAAAEAGSAEDAEVGEDAEAAAEAASQDAEAVAVVAAGAAEDPEPAGAAPPTAWEDPAAAGSADEDEAEPEPVEQDSGPAEPVISTVWEEPELEEPELEEPEVAEPELPPVWEDEAEPAGDEAEPAEESPADDPPETGTTSTEGRPGFWMQLRRTLGLD